MWVGLAGQFSGLGCTHSGSCGHLMSCLPEAGEFSLASLLCWGRWCWVVGSPSFPCGLSLFSHLSQVSLHGSSSVQRGERGNLQGLWSLQLWETHTLSFLLCSTGQNKSRGQPASRGGEIVDTIT